MSITIKSLLHFMCIFRFYISLVLDEVYIDQSHSISLPNKTNFLQIQEKLICVP